MKINYSPLALVSNFLTNQANAVNGVKYKIVSLEGRLKSCINDYTPNSNVSGQLGDVLKPADQITISTVYSSGSSEKCVLARVQ
jgi:hypothetical protein